MFERVCAVCDASFAPGSNRARYCSPACRAEARRRRQRAERPDPVGNRREGFRVVIDGVEGVWRPRYLVEDRDRLASFMPEDLRSMPGRFDLSKSRGQVDRQATSLARDAARMWALETYGVDIGADL